MVRVLLADDHQMVREGLRALLERCGFEVVAEAEDGRAAVDLAETHHPDVVVLDLAMPRLNGLGCAREILSRNGNTTAIIVLTVHSEEHLVVEALRAGVRGYVVKTQAAGELMQAIRDVCAGGVFLSPRVSRVLVDAYLTDGRTRDALTPRQREVLRLVADGKSTREVADDELGVSTKTAELYRSRMMARLDIHDTAGLVRYAISHGLIEI
jgi:DNA-binding NarL/FixJ family response regulator